MLGFPRAAEAINDGLGAGSIGPSEAEDPMVAKVGVEPTRTVKCARF